MFLIIITTITIIISTLFSSFGQNLIQQKLSEFLPGDIAWNYLRINPIIGEVQLDTVRIYGEDSLLVVGFNLLDLNVNIPRSILNKKLVIEKLVVEDLYTDININLEEQINIIECFVHKKKKPKEDKKDSKTASIIPKLPILVEDLQLKNLTGKFSMQKHKMFTYLDSGYINLTSDMSKEKAQIRLKMARVGYTNNSVNANINKVDMFAKISKNNVDTVCVFANIADKETIEITGKTDFVTNPDSMLLNNKIKLYTTMPTITKMVPSIPKMDGVVKIEIDANGLLNNPDTDIKIDTRNFRFDKYKIDQFLLNVSMKNRNAHIKNLSIKQKNSQIKSDGFINFQQMFSDGIIKSSADVSKLTSNLKISVKNSKISDFGLIKPNTEILNEGILNADLKINSSGIEPQNMKANISGKIELIDFYKNVKTASEKLKESEIKLMLNGNLSNGKVFVDNFDAHIKNALKANGKASFVINSKRIDANINVTVPKIANITPLVEITDLDGSANIEIKSNGNFDDFPKTTLILDANSLQFKNFKSDTTKIIATMQKDGKIEISKLSLKNDTSQINLTGNYDIFAKDSNNIFDIKIDETDFNFKDFITFKDKNDSSFLNQINGQIKLDANIKGSPKKPKGNINLAIKNLISPFQNLDSILFNINSLSDTIFINKGEINLSKNSKIDIGGWYSFDENFSLNILSNPILIDDINKLDSIDLDGKILLKVDAKGDVKNPQAIGSLNILDANYKEKKLKSMLLSLNLKDYLANVNAELGYSVKGLYNIKTNDFDGKIDFNNIEISDYFKLFNMPKFNGYIDGEIYAKGNILKQDEIDGTIKLDNVEINFDSLNLLKTNDLDITYYNKVLEINKFDFNLLQDGNIKAKGYLNTKKELDVNIDANVPLSIASYFVPKLDGINGYFKANFYGSGKINNPNLDTKFKIVDGFIPIDATSQNIKNLNADISATKHKIDIKNFYGNLDDGLFNIDGHIDLKEDKTIDDWDLKIKATTMPFIIEDALASTFNIDLSSKGSLEKSSIDGEVELIEGSYFKDILFSMDMLSSVTKKTRAKVKKTKITQTTPLDNANLNIYVKRKNPFYVENNMAELKLVPDLQIKGTASKPFIDGRAQIENDGIIKFLSKEFNINRGIVNFKRTQGYENDPELDIEAVSEINDWTITLKISGYASDFNFELSSTPYEEDSDIISIILTGNKMKASETIGASQDAIIQNMLLSMAANSLQKSTGLDVVEMEIGSSDGSTEQNSLSLTIGEKLSRRLMTYYTIETTSQEILQKAIAEYKLLDNLNINGYQTNDRNSGFFLEYDRKFR